MADMNGTGVNSEGKKIWSVNGLVYTLGGLVALFALMTVCDFTWAMKDRSVGMITKLMLKKFGASDALNGLLIVSVPSLMGLVISPIISYRSDRHRGRLGRRVPYLLCTLPIVVAGMIGMGFSPTVGRWLEELVGHLPVFQGESGFDVNRATLFSIGFFWIVFELGMIVANTVFIAFVNDVVPKAVIGRFMSCFRIVSLAAGVIFSWWMLGWLEDHNAYLLLYFGVAMLYTAGMVAMCIFVKEGTYPPPPAPVAGETKFRAIAATKTYFQECYTHPYYLLMFLAFLLFAIYAMPVNTYLVFYAQSLNLSLKVYGKYISYSFIVSGCLAFPLGWLADRFHPLRCSLVVLVLYAVGAVYCALTIHDELTFGIAVLCHSILSGSFATISASLRMRLLPQDRFAQFSSAAGLISSLVNAGLVPLLGWVLDCSGSDYSLLYWFNGGLAAVALLVGLALYTQFRRYGGVKNYVAPPV